MKILLTGASGFLGRVIINILQTHHQIVTLSRTSADISVDLSKSVPNLPFSETVVHVAGKAHFLPKNENEGRQFFNVNVTGTKNLLQGLENSTQLPKYFIFISSVSVYGIEAGDLITENTPLLAKSPYGLSKLESEKIIKQWCLQHNIVCTILRLPLIAGTTPPGNLGSMIRSIQKGFYFNIAGGKARKSIVLADDVAKIIPIAAKIGGTYNLTDGYHPTVKELSVCISNQLYKKVPLSIPMVLAKSMAKIGDLIGNKAPINSYKLDKIISNLTFNDNKAVNAFNWKPTKVLEGLKIK